MDDSLDKRLQNLKPFPPGVSGNPGGRPKTASLSKAYREILDRVNPKTGLTGAQEVAEALFREAKKGNIWAAKELATLTEGKLTEAKRELLDRTSSAGAAKRLLQKLIRVEETPNGMSVTLLQQERGSVSIAESAKQMIEDKQQNGRAT